MSCDCYRITGVIVVILLVGAIMYGEAQGAPANFYVATNGNDGWSGTLPAPNAAGTNGPFATLNRARDAIRELKAGEGLRQPLKVLVRGGTYYMPETLTLATEDSGTASFPITYMAYAGEKVVLSGGRPVTGWKPYRGNIWQCDLKALGLGELSFKQLFYNGVRQPLARFPNVDPQRPRTRGFLYVFDGGEKDKRLLKYDPAHLDPTKWAKPNEVEVNVYPYHNWNNHIMPIAEIDLDNHVLTLADDALYELIHDTHFYIQNAFEELDAPGEWYVDSEAGTLYFWPPDDNLVQSQVVVPALDTIIWMVGDSGSNPLGYLRMGGFAIQECRDTAVILDKAEHCTIAKCIITNISRRGISIGGVDNRVVGNDIAHIGGVAVSIGGQNNLLSNNHIYDTGVITNFFNQAISLGGRGNVASHNLVHDVPAWGMVFTGRENILEYNEIHHFGLSTNLGWGIYSNGRPPGIKDNILRFNKVSDSVGYGMPAPGTWGPNPAHGICLDDFVSYTTVYGNVLVRNIRGGLLIHSGTDNVVENNIMAAGIPSTSNHLRPGDELCNNKIFRNIVYYANADPDLVYQYGWTVKGITETSASAAAVPVFLCGWSSVKAAVSESDYNLLFPIRGENVRALLLYRGAGKAFFGPWADEPVEDRFVWWRSQGYDAHSVIGDPLFVAPERDDYRLRPESPAFKLGFKPIPQERIGLYPSPNRASWPVDDGRDTWQGEYILQPLPHSEVHRGPKPDRPRPEFKAAKGTAGIIVDGDVGEWPWNDETQMVVLEQSYTGWPTDAPKSYACAAYDNEALYIAIRNLVGDPQALKTDGGWAKADGVEIALQDVSGDKRGQVLNLYGYSDGQLEAGHTWVDTPDEAAKKLAGAATYAAQIGAEDWCCEWRIPWAAAGINPGKTKRLWFNIGVRKMAADAWVVWEGTGASNYMLVHAGDLVLLP